MRRSTPSACQGNGVIISTDTVIECQGNCSMPGCQSTRYDNGDCYLLTGSMINTCGAGVWTIQPCAISQTCDDVYLDVGDNATAPLNNWDSAIGRAMYVGVMPMVYSVEISSPDGCRHSVVANNDDPTKHFYVGLSPRPTNLHTGTLIKTITHGGDTYTVYRSVKSTETGVVSFSGVSATTKVMALAEPTAAFYGFVDGVKVDTSHATSYSSSGLYGSSDYAGIVLSDRIEPGDCSTSNSDLELIIGLATGGTILVVTTAIVTYRYYRTKPKYTRYIE